MSRDLPARPHLEHLRKQAKELLRQFRQGQSAAVDRFRSVPSLANDPKPALADALHVIAHEYGFGSWPQLKEYVESTANTAIPLEQLGVAVRSNRAEQVREVLDRHPGLRMSINDAAPGLGFGATALLGAVQHGNREMIDMLLRAGANVAARSDWWAGSFGVLDSADAELVPFLLERGAVPDAHAAARLGMLDTLDALVSADPSLVQARGGDGQTPLHFASSVAIAGYLLDHGADIDARDVDHESTPAQWMVRDRSDVARFLVARGCHTDILMAAALGDLALVRRHLDADPDSIRMSVSDEYFPKRDPRSGGSIYIWTLGWNKTAHLLAREFGHDDIFDLLMSRSSDELKLAQACEAGDEGIVRTLLDRNPQLAASLSTDGKRKLAHAARNNNTAAVRLMLMAGWPVDARGEHGGTPLHWASWHGNAEMVRELLRHKAPPEIRGDEHNLTPLGWALHGSVHGWYCKTGDYAGTVEALLQAGAHLPEPNDTLEASAPVREALRRNAARPLA